MYLPVRNDKQLKVLQLDRKRTFTRNFVNIFKPELHNFIDSQEHEPSKQVCDLEKNKQCV